MGFAEIVLGLVAGAGKEIYDLWKTSNEETRAQIEADCLADGANAEDIAAKYRKLHDERTTETRRIIDETPQ